VSTRKTMSGQSNRTNLNLTIEQPGAVVPVSAGQKSPRGVLQSAFTGASPTPSTSSTMSPSTPLTPTANAPTPEPQSESSKLFLANTLLAVEKMEEEQQFTTERQTALNFTFLTVLSYIRQLITAVNNKFNDQFVDITATIVHEGGEIMRLFSKPSLLEYFESKHNFFIFLFLILFFSCREIKDTFQEYDNNRKSSGGKDDSQDCM